MSFLYIILAVIAIILYLIYRRLKTPTLPTKAEAREKILEMIAQKETSFLDNRLKSSHLKEYLEMDAVLFDCGSQNFIRLNERFKHDEAKFAEIVKDWSDYLDILGNVVFQSEMLDVCTSEESEEHYQARQEDFVRIQEIEKRFKGLLADSYIDPDVIKDHPTLIQEIKERYFKTK